MICKYGMSDRLGPVCFGDDDADVFLGRDFITRKDYSEKKAEEIDEEVSKILIGLYNEARQELTDHRGMLDCIAEALLERETLDTADLAILMDGKTLPPLPVPVEPPRREEPPKRSRPERAKDFPGDKLPDPEPIPG
jgi:cell division protease FtsH